MELSNYIATFLDILGQTELLLKYSVIQDIDESDPEYKLWVKSTFGRINTFKGAFDTFLKSLKTDRINTFHIPNYNFDKIKIASFSDNLILYTSLSKINNRIPILDVSTMIGATALIFLYYLSCGVPFRGGIDIGIGMVLDNIGLYGSIIPKVYMLESKSADYPRIVLGKDIVRFFKNVLNKNIVDLNSKLAHAIAKDTLDYCICDSDSIYMVDILHPLFRKIYGVLGTETYNKAYAYISSQLEINLHKSTETAVKIFNRYNKLKAYFDSRNDLWK